MNTVVIGYGEVGRALCDVLDDQYQVYAVDSVYVDPKHGSKIDIGRGPSIMHICIPWSPRFIESVLDYEKLFGPNYVVIHSSVPVGTTYELSRSSRALYFHSPIRGMHPEMEKGIRAHTKYVSYDAAFFAAEQVKEYFEKCGIKVKLMLNTKTSELAKLLELSRYGVYLAFAKEQEDICKKFGVNYEDVVTEYDKTRNFGLKEVGADHLAFPLLTPFSGYVGGHCTVEDMAILLEQNETPILKIAHDIDRGTKVWGPCNIYKTAKIGKGCSIGFGTEIGNNVVIGNNVRIGAGCFIPEGVTIESDCFIAPKVVFSNDKHPPSKSKEKWGKIIVREKAVLGIGSIILPGVEIGRGAMVGAGAVVTKSIPDGELWYGVPANPRGEWVNPTC